jgi:hypothetical protein
MNCGSLFCVTASEMLTLFVGHREWSFATFGPPSFKGPKGPLSHLRKESEEAHDEPDPEEQKVEIVDCLLLVFDAAHRVGMNFAEVCQVAREKLAVNKQRQWPDWRGTDPDEPIEHVREVCAE